MPNTAHRTCPDARNRFFACRPLRAPLVLAALSLCGVARADAGAGANDELLKRIERLEASNAALTSEIATLRKADGEEWLSEERAGQIRAIVTDVLADSATRTSLQSSGMSAGWNDGFFLRSEDDRFRLEVGGLIQTRYIYGYIPNGTSGVSTGNALTIADNLEARSGFDLPNTQLDFRGHVFGSQFSYRLRGQFSNLRESLIGAAPIANIGPGSGTFRLLDAWIRAEVSDGIALRAGQFRLPFAREQLVDDDRQLAVSRSTIVDHLGLGYSQGIEAQLVSDDLRLMAAVSNGGTDNTFGIIKGAGSDPLNSSWMTDRVDWAVTGRAEWKFAGEWSQFSSMTSPPGDSFAFLLGVGAHAQSGDPDVGLGPNAQKPNDWLALTVDASAMFGGSTLFGSFTYAYMDSGSASILGGGNFGPPVTSDIGTVNAWGAVVQGSMYFDPKIEAFVRMEVGGVDLQKLGTLTPSGAGTLDRGNIFAVSTIGFNWYIDGEDLKFTSDVGFAWDSVDGVWTNQASGWRASQDQSEIVFRMQLQMAF